MKVYVVVEHDWVAEPPEGVFATKEDAECWMGPYAGNYRVHEYEVIEEEPCTT